MRQPGRRNKLTVKEIVNAIKWIIILGTLGDESDYSSQGTDCESRPCLIVPNTIKKMCLNHPSSPLKVEG